MGLIPDEPARLELLKSLVLTVLILFSLVLSVILWLPDDAVSSLPPELSHEQAGANFEESDMSHLVQPVEAIVHTGEGDHRSLSSAEAQELVAAAEGLVSTLRKEDLTEVTAEYELTDELLRWQLKRKGATLVLPGKIPLDLWLWSLGGAGDTPDIPVDRVFFFISEDKPDRLELYIGGPDGWMNTEWSIVGEFESVQEEADQAEAGLPLFEQEDVAGKVVALAEQLDDMTDINGEEVMLLRGWRDIEARSLLGIPKMNPQVQTAVAEMIVIEGEQDVRPFFSDFVGVRKRVERDSSRVYTDEYSSVRLPAGGGIQYTMISPQDRENEVEPPTRRRALLESYRFLRRTTGSMVEDIRLVDISEQYERGTLDWETGKPEVSGYTLQFSQVLDDGRIVFDGEGPITITVDDAGVREAQIETMQSASRVQDFQSITPISALQRSHEMAQDSGWVEDEEDIVVERLQIVYYPAERTAEETERVLRPAWSVDLGPVGFFLVDAVSGEIVFASDGY